MRTSCAQRTSVSSMRKIRSPGARPAALAASPSSSSNATTVTVDEAPALAERFGGVCYPAHIDREANGIVSILGTVPEDPDFSCVELRDMDKREAYLASIPHLRDKTFVCGSDAHYLWDIRDADAYFDLEDEPYSGDLVRHQLFLRLKGVQ